MTGQNKKWGISHNRTTWSALALYAAAGWAAAEVLLSVRERYGLPEALDNIVLGLLLAGLAAICLLFATGGLARRSPLLSVSRIFAVAVFASALALGVSAWLGLDDRADGIPSVAVLPCDYEGAEEHAFLGPAAAQEIHARLAKVAGLQIPAWRSVLKSTQAGKNPQQVAELLQVEHLARCIIAEDEDGIELSARILNPETEEPVWSGRQAYASADLVQALGDISVAIADALSVRLTADESDRLIRTPTSSPEAYEHYLRARQAQGTRQLTIPNMYIGLAIEEEDYATVMEHYRTATHLDPDFAEAWAGMATVTDAFALLAPGQAFSGSVEREYKEEAQEFARRALELDPCNAEALLLAWPERSETDVDDEMTETGDGTDDIYQVRVARVQRAIDCEPNNASAWLAKTHTYSYFNVWQARSTGSQIPAAEVRATMKKTLSLDPTNCPIVAYYIRIFRDRFWAPRPEDRLTLEETKQAIRSALFVDPGCGDMYDILYEISVQQGRMDEAIAWRMRRSKLDPDNVYLNCNIGVRLARLGFFEEAQPWLDRANDVGQLYACVSRTYLECMDSREAYFSERCKTDRLELAKQLMTSDYASASDREQVFRYRQGLYEAQTSDRPDLLRQWLNEGLEWLGTDDPVAILGKDPKRSITARREGLELVPIFRDLGLDEAADRMLELCRRDPDDPEQVVWDMDAFLYIDARHRALVGKKSEAWELLSRAVREHQTLGDWHFPDQWELLFDRALDPLREDPVYGPQLEALIKEYYDWLAPARERTATALETGDWASLRTLIEETPEAVAAIDRGAKDDERHED